jgi:hypothetical protein
MRVSMKGEMLFEPALRTALRPSSGPSGHLLPEGEEEFLASAGAP